MQEKVPVIVVIDDSPTSLSLYELSTVPLDVELRTFQSPAESLEYLERHSADLVFLDLIMREMDGLSILRRLRDLDKHSRSPVIIVTSKDYAQDRTLTAELGALDYRVKPLTSHEIRSLICAHTTAEPQRVIKPGS